MSERGPGAEEPEGTPPAALPWYSRMERQAPVPPTPAGPPPAASGPATAASRPTTALPKNEPTAALPKSGPASHSAPAGEKPKTTLPPGRRRGNPSRRKPSAALVWWTLGALILASAAVVAILFNDPQSPGTPAADTQDPGATDAVTTTEPSFPLPGESTGFPTDPAATDPALSTAPTAAPPGTGDLGLAKPMVPPACDGTWVVILGSATNPNSYAADVETLLARDPNAQYVLTQGACTSLRQQLDDGTVIYAVYVGPYADQAAACGVSTTVGGGAYVKRMDTTTPPDQTYEC